MTICFYKIGTKITFADKIGEERKEIVTFLLLNEKCYDTMNRYENFFEHYKRKKDFRPMKVCA